MIVAAMGTANRAMIPVFPFVLRRKNCNDREHFELCGTLRRCRSTRLREPIPEPALRVQYGRFGGTETALSLIVFPIFQLVDIVF